MYFTVLVYINAFEDNKDERRKGVLVRGSKENLKNYSKYLYIMSGD